MRLIAHLDMNSYFASVEQQANPFLRGKPIGVCAYLHKNGCVIAASVEAKKMGMKVGMTVGEARETVPSASFVENDPAKYRTVTSKVFAILHELSDTIEHYSIDEAFVDLTGWCRDEAEAAFLLSRAKSRIRKEIGEWLSCSVGIAPTRFLAKFASDKQKPDGLVIVTLNNLDELLDTSDLGDLCGIGPRMRRRMELIGIRTPLELKRHPIGNLMRAFGKAGFFWWCKLNALECEQLIDADNLPKSIGHSYCVPNRVNHEGKVEAVLAKLTERAGRRLRALGLETGAMSVAVGTRGSYEHGGDWTRFSEPASDSFVLSRGAAQLLKRVWNKRPVDFLAVTLFELALPTNQLRLGRYGMSLADYRSNESGVALFAMRDRRELAVSASIDSIRDRYGDQSILLGRMSSIINDEQAPERIGFRKTVGPESRGESRDQLTLQPE